MTTLNVTSVSGEAIVGPDQSWRGLYRAGAVSAAIYVLMIIIPLVLISVFPLPPLTGGAALLEYIAVHKLVYMIEYVSFVGLGLPAIFVFLALYLALKDIDKTYIVLGATTGIASEIIALAYNSSPQSLHGGLLLLSDHYVMSTSVEQRTALATAAEAVMAVANGVSAAGILTALGIFLVSLAMLKGIFAKSVAYLGLATGAIGIVSETLRTEIGLGYIVFGLMLPLWFITVGWSLYRLSRD